MDGDFSVFQKINTVRYKGWEHEASFMTDGNQIERHLLFSQYH